MKRLKSQVAGTSLLFRSTLALTAVTTTLLVVSCGTAVAPGVVLKIQGSRPATSSLSALQLLGVTDATTPVSVQIPVIGKGSSGQIGILNLTEARVILRSIEIKSESEGVSVSSAETSSDDSSSSETEFTGPYVVDLLRDSVSPSLETLELPVGTYKSIGLKIHKPEDNELTSEITESDTLRENSISLAGTYTATGGSAVAFSLTYDLSEEFELAGSGFDLSDVSSQSVVIAFRLAKWFDFSDTDVNDKNRDFSDLSAGAIALTKDSGTQAAKEVHEVIKEAIKASADFGKDEDGDGRLGSDEDSDEEDAEELEQEEERQES